MLTDDTISFARKTSSELHWDYLRFYIDGIKKAEWSGLMGWGNSSFQVTPGIHTFKWVYEKDAVVSAHEDKVWLDNIYLPAFITATTGISNNSAVFNLNTYPNPTTDLLNISYQVLKYELVSIKLIESVS